MFCFIFYIKNNKPRYQIWFFIRSDLLFLSVISPFLFHYSFFNSFDLLNTGLWSGFCLVSSAFYRIVLKQEWTQASLLPIYSLYSLHTNDKYLLWRLIVLAEHSILWIQILKFYKDNFSSLIVSFSTSYV